MDEYVKIKYPGSRKNKALKMIHEQIVSYVYDTKPEVSAVVLELKKCEKNKINRILIKTKIRAGNVKTEKDIELLQLRRYFATIRALEYNCMFIRNALSIKRDDYINNLSNLSFTYLNNKMIQSSPDITRTISVNSSRMETDLSYNSINHILTDSIELIEEFEKKLNHESLAIYIEKFESLYDNALNVKTKVINDAKQILNTLSSESGRKVLYSVSTKISETSTLKK